MAGITADQLGTSSSIEHLERIGARITCTLLGHDFAAGIAGIVLRLPTCRRCGHTRDA